MPKIEWEDRFSVNNDEIDGQHKKWMELHNKMHQHLINKGAAGDSSGAEILMAMLEYARYHFSFEEEYLRKINYPDLAKHRRLHKNFDNQTYAYHRDIQEGKIVLNTTILRLLKNWLYDHIVNEDKKFARFLEENPS